MYTNTTTKAIVRGAIAAVALLGAIAATSCASSGSNAAPAPTAASTKAATPAKAPAAATAAAPSAIASSAPGSDGLVLIKSTPTERVYARPGATLKQYTKFAILDCYVSFAPNWRDDMQTNFNLPLTDMQIQQMKTSIASEFKSVFVSQLEQGGYPLVDTAGPDVLVLRPALVNVYVTAPQSMDPDESTISSTTGSLTLILELYDSSTSKLLARVIDAEGASATNGVFMFQTRAGNITAAREVMASWADRLRNYLEAARAAQ